MTKIDVTEKLVEDLKLVLENAEDLLQSTKGGSGKKFEAARDKFMDGISAIKDAQSKLKTKTSAALESSGRYVRQHPYETAGGGLAVMLAVAGAVLWYQRFRS